MADRARWETIARQRTDRMGRDVERAIGCALDHNTKKYQADLTAKILEDLNICTC